jgi:UPF0716 family protein affecting phage T7 exclusion
MHDRRRHGNKPEMAVVYGICALIAGIIGFLVGLAF